MVAAPQYATIVLSNGSSNINVDVYLSDVASASARFDSGAGAGAATDTFFKCPINGYIVDFAIATGMTDTTKARVTINNSPTKSIVRYANHLNSLNNRPSLRIPVRAGENIGMVQLA